MTSRITKEMKPSGHVGVRRWMRYVVRNVQMVLAEDVVEPEKYLHASRRRLDSSKA